MLHSLAVLVRVAHCLLPLPLAFGLLLAGLNSGCRLVQSAVDVPGQTVRAVTPDKKDKRAVDPVAVQQTLLRFANEFSTRMILGVDKLRRGTNALDPSETLQWKIALDTETCSIASGPNAVANLLDMTIFVTVTQMALEEHWQPKVFGESALPMLESSRNAEKEIWQLASTVLTPVPENVLAARALGFASRVAQASRDEAAKPGSVFSLLKVDPLSGIDPAVREIAQTRLFAERALYVTQKLPMLLRWQTELLSVNTAELPAVRQLVTNSTQIAVSVERFSAVAEKLPGQISTEREEILKALQSQEENLTSLVAGVRETITEGSQMSTSLNTTLLTFDSLMNRFGVGETHGARPLKTNSEPFRIQDYTATAAQLEATARQMTELLVTLDRTIGSTNLLQLSTQIGPVVQQAQSSGKEVVDYAFWKGILLLVIVLVAGLIYHVLGAHLTPATNSDSNSP
jgi:hypothetical protein